MYISGIWYCVAFTYSARDGEMLLKTFPFSNSFSFISYVPFEVAFTYFRQQMSAHIFTRTVSICKKKYIFINEER